jgi:hypothetical protein
VYAKEILAPICNRFLASTLKGVLEGNTTKTLMLPFILPKVWSNLLPDRRNSWIFLEPVIKLAIAERYPAFSAVEMFYPLEKPAFTRLVDEL